MATEDVDEVYRTSVSIRRDLMNRFTEIYPMQGAFTWFVNACLEEFSKQHDPEELRDILSSTVDRAVSSHMEENNEEK